MILTKDITARAWGQWAIDDAISDWIIHDLADWYGDHAHTTNDTTLRLEERLRQLQHPAGPQLGRKTARHRRRGYLAIAPRPLAARSRRT